MKRLLSIRWLPFLFACATLSAKAQEATELSQELTTAYVAAFNKGDAKALGEFYAEDAEMTGDQGEPTIGRQAVVETMTRFFEQNPESKLEVQVTMARFLTPDVLLEKGFASFGEETTKYVCNYIKKDGKWLISELNEFTMPAADAASQALEGLAWMEGKWKDETTEMNVAMEVSWTKNRHFLRRSIEVTNSDGETTLDATEVIGFDPMAGKLRSSFFDSEGGFGEGFWTQEGDRWSVSFKCVAPDGTSSSAQHVISFVDENKYTWESINRQSEGEALPNVDKVQVIRVKDQ